MKRGPAEGDGLPPVLAYSASLGGGLIEAQGEGENAGRHRPGIPPLWEAASLKHERGVQEVAPAEPVFRLFGRRPH